MAHASRRPSWRLPPGVSRGSWEYFASQQIADTYDEYYQGDPLCELDQQLLVAELTPKGLVADLGCGVGRALLPLVRSGHQGLAIDLSEPMLRSVRERALAEELPIHCVLANLVDLGCLANECVDHAICLYSTLGMIRGATNRATALSHTHRILKPGGRFVLHVHNTWFNLRDPGGPLSLAKNAWSKCRGSDVELGDRYFPYRGVANFFLHAFRPAELRNALRHAGFIVRRWVPLESRRRGALKAPWLAQSLRANGWLVVCQKP